MVNDLIVCEQTYLARREPDGSILSACDKSHSKLFSYPTGEGFITDNGYRRDGLSHSFSDTPRSSWTISMRFREHLQTRGNSTNMLTIYEI